MNDCVQGNIQIRNATTGDFEWIKKLWYLNRDTLSIPFNRCIQELCVDKNCWIVEVDDIPIAIGRIHFYRRCYEIRIEHLVVDERFRGNGIGTMLLRHLIKNFCLKDISLIEPDIVANAVVGAKNNLFYDKFAKSKTVLQRKTKTLYRYVLDKERIF